MSIDYAEMPLADYEAACDVIRNKIGISDSIKSGELADKINLIGSAIDADIHSYIQKGTLKYYDKTIPNLKFKDDDTLYCVNFPAVTTLAEEEFSDCINLRNAVLDGVTTAGNNAFYYCWRMENISIPKLTAVSDGMFYSCVNLRHVELPEVESVGVGSFYGCTGLESIILPKVKTVGEGGFYGCFIRLKKLDLPSVTSIGSMAFAGCNALDTLILRTTETVVPVPLDAFDSTKIQKLEGHIYVPASMYEYYRAAYADALNTAYEQMGVSGAFDILMRKIEDYPEICGEVTS